MEKDLVRIVGRKNVPGRPLIYGTTKKFLELFSLKNIESLPKLKEIKALGIAEHERQPIIEGIERVEGSKEENREFQFTKSKQNVETNTG